MPSYYVSEARVLVGLQSPRLPTVDSIVADGRQVDGVIDLSAASTGCR